MNELAKVFFERKLVEYYVLDDDGKELSGPEAWDYIEKQCLEYPHIAIPAMQWRRHD